MSLGSRCWPAVVLIALASPSAHAADWGFTQAEGGDLIELAGPGQPFSVRRYTVQTSVRPYVHLTRSVRASEINYFVDEMSRGVVSGNLRHQVNIYAACRREIGELVCIELYYPPDLQSEYTEMIADIARTFVQQDQP